MTLHKWFDFSYLYSFPRGSIRRVPDVFSTKGLGRGRNAYAAAVAFFGCRDLKETGAGGQTQGRWAGGPPPPASGRMAPSGLDPDQ